MDEFKSASPDNLLRFDTKHKFIVGTSITNDTLAVGDSHHVGDILNHQLESLQAVGKLVLFIPQILLQILNPRPVPAD